MKRTEHKNLATVRERERERELHSIKIKNKKGITLVALVVTIIILLILVGISIQALKGTRLLGKIQIAKSNTEEAQEKENIAINSYEEALDNVLNHSNQSDAGVTHISNNKWIAPMPKDSWISKKEYYDINWDGQGTSESPYIISDEKELAGLSYQVANGITYDLVYFKLTSDLSMGKHIWVPIGGKDISDENENYYKKSTTNIFQGFFEGDGHSISGLYYNNEDSNYGTCIGLFGYIKPSTFNSNYGIKNIKIIDSYLNGYSNIGSISGYINNIRIVNCSNNSIISGKSSIGGIVGRGYGASIYYCHNKGYICNTIETKNTAIYIGGLIGDGNVNCYSSYNTAEIFVKSTSSQTNINIGGINESLQNSTTVINSYNTGNIIVETASDKTFIGGLIGYMDIGGIQNSYNVGNIQSNKGYVGGLVGEVPSSSLSKGSLYCCYFLKNGVINSSISSVGICYSKSRLASIGYFDSFSTTNFTYTDDTTEADKYKGDLLTKLNVYASNDSRALSWQEDENDGHPVFIYNQ